MKHNRFLDFVFVLLSVDMLNFALHIALWLLFGPDKDDPVLATMSTIL